MTVEVILNQMKYLCIHNVSIHINFYQKRFINECVGKTFLKFPYRRKNRRKDGVFKVLTKGGNTSFYEKKSL